MLARRIRCGSGVRISWLRCFLVLNARLQRVKLCEVADLVIASQLYSAYVPIYLSDDFLHDCAASVARAPS